MEPALATRRARPRIPCDRQSLHATVRHRDEVLLQRVNAEGVANLELRWPPIAAVGPHEKLAVALDEHAPRARVVERRVREIAKYGLVGRDRHGRAMMRPIPALAFRQMTRSTVR